MKAILSAAAALCLTLGAGAASAQKFAGLAPTPPMGWNSWNHVGCNVSEETLKVAADQMVSSGMKAVGYQYVVVDDCWHGARDADGFIRADPKRFPNGIKAVADYVHAKGLKFGIYSDAGWKTCGGRPGSRGYEFQDALSYARWGVDYLKYDWCNTEGLNAEGAYQTMRDALFASKRPVVFSLCEWGSYKPWLWGKDVGHLWRTTGDVHECFDCVVDHGTWKSWGVLQILDMQEGLRAHAGPDHWNDPDMLEVGNGMSVAEDRAHFSLWAMLAAPLMAGNDLAKMTPATREILTNAEVIAVDQDKLGVQGYRAYKLGDVEVWAKPLSEGNLAVTFLNRGGTTASLRYDWKDHRVEDLVSKTDFDFKKATYKIRNLWTHQALGSTSKDLMLKIAPHDVVVLRLSP
ncbi:MAG TPA: glycoside hydrolase family 27 protein [Polyangiaceae bacterium]|jgi:alpha-galactosidase|nr:glycoside hydrolase family 27 protein [Polyangiaceae bacterium]